MVLTLLLSLAASAASPAMPSCRPAELAIATDGGDGDFNGMSHSGVRLIVRNRGRHGCVIPALPRLRLLDVRGRALPAVRHVPPGLHPGPVMVPLRLRPGERATTDLRWVSGEVYDRSRCVTPARIALAVDGGSVRAPLAAHLCGPAGQPVGFDQPPLGPPPG